MVDLNVAISFGRGGLFFNGFCSRANMSSLALNRDMTRVLRIFRACQTKQIELIEKDETYYQKSDTIMINEHTRTLFTRPPLKNDENLLPAAVGVHVPTTAFGLVLSGNDKPVNLC